MSGSGGSQSSGGPPSNYISGLVSRSNLLLGSLKQQCASYLTGAGDSELPKAASNNMQSSVTGTSAEKCVKLEVGARPRGQLELSGGQERRQQIGAQTASATARSELKLGLAPLSSCSGAAGRSSAACVVTAQNHSSLLQRRQEKRREDELKRRAQSQELRCDTSDERIEKSSPDERPAQEDAGEHNGEQQRQQQQLQQPQQQAQVEQEQIRSTSDGDVKNGDNQFKATTTTTTSMPNSIKLAQATTPKKPPLPPPPPPEVLQAVAARAPAQTKPSHETSSQSRRHALQEHSLERDAALSLKVVHARELKQRRASSIKSALRRAHLGHLRPSAGRRAAREAAASALAACLSNRDEICAVSTSGGVVIGGSKKANAKRTTDLVRSMPYELFEPPVTQRTVERSRRRGAMASQHFSAPTNTSTGSTSGTELEQSPQSSLTAPIIDSELARRQLSFDSIGLRQLTDEYLENAGLSREASRQMVALGRPVDLARQTQARPGEIAVPGGSSTVAAVVAATVGGGTQRASASHQAQCALEAQLYQATRRAENEQLQAGDGRGPASSGSGSNGATPISSRRTQKLTNSAGSLDSRNTWHRPARDRENSGGGGVEERRLDTDEVICLPGQMPWQCDVSIQCELLQGPASVEPYETTGDILDTIARPFKGPALSSYAHTASFESAGHNANHHHHHHQLSATLKRGLSAISQHHLSPGNSFAGSVALNVVGSLKKSISNTFDANAAKPSQPQAALGMGTGGVSSPSGAGCNPLSSALNLRSQDSLSAYEIFHNEQDVDEGEHKSLRTSLPKLDQQQLKSYQLTSGIAAANELQQQQPSLIGQLASKLSRKSSKKFTEGKRGLQRALSFDCRGYKRLGQTLASATGTSQPVGSSGTAQPSSLESNGSSSTNSSGQTQQQQQQLQPLAQSRQKAYNKSSLTLSSPRPYLPQSASQVDFQVPLLPYERMQEAIVSQRLLEPPAAQPMSKPAGVGNSFNSDSTTSVHQKQPDADELICGRSDSPERTHDNRDQLETGGELKREPSRARATDCDWQRNSLPNIERVSQQSQPLPRLVFNVETNANDKEQVSGGSGQTQLAQVDWLGAQVAAGDNQMDCQQVAAAPISIQTTNCATPANNVIACLPSPGIHLEPGGCGSFEPSGQLSQSPSFTLLDPKAAQGDGSGSGGSNLLTASDVFKRSKNFIKRPSTMMASDEAEDAMNQVAAALGQAATRQQQQQQQSQLDGSAVQGNRRNRRQAIVPPKLATDGGATSSESDHQAAAQVGRLVDLGDLAEPPVTPGNWRSRRHRYGRESSSMDEFCAEEEAQLSTIRRKRSGGGIEKLSRAAHQQAAAPVPSLVVDEATQRQQPSAASQHQGHCQRPGESRPDSQATNADSIVSSESTQSVNMSGVGGRLSPFGQSPMSMSSEAATPTGAISSTSLAVPFVSGSSSRRRSSIAVIPQMQICPGDLLVYSKQLIDRMNQTDENEPPQFLTIDDKKSKNIWSSFKLCAQFDSRTLRARNELLCSLEDVLASLQPSTFVDEQLSHYKGMLWNEFLCETESRRSASSENGSGAEGSTTPPLPAKHSYKDELIDQIQVISAPQVVGPPEQEPAGHRRTESMHANELGPKRESLKATLSTGASSQATHSAKTSPVKSGGPDSGGAAQKSPPTRSIGSRFREKPKLKRGQTVDSVFRIPLIPSSPLKHAQQHQQTPTAHLEDHELKIIEDDERSSMGSANSGGAPSATSIAMPPVTAGDQQLQDGSARSASLGRQKRSSSTRSRSGGRQTIEQAADASCEPSNRSAALASHSQESSLDMEDARDLLDGSNGTSPARPSRRPPATSTPNQLKRQSSMSTLASTVTRTEQKRQRALWDLFQSECTFFFDHLLTLKNVYMEPLKKIQVEGFAMFADPDVLFGNLDELCCGVYDFCKEFLYIIMRTLKTRPEELNATDVLIKLYKKNPKIDHLRAVYHRYTLNYINALTYLDSLRRQVEFVEFEKWSSRDVRCKKLQLTDLLVAPVQHIMRVPIILKDIEAHTENLKDRDEIRAILAVEEASLRELDDKMRWLKNFERLLEIQKNIQWPSVFEMELKLYVPEFLRDVLSKQPCEKLIVSPKRQIVHEGTLSNLDLNGKASDMHVILFDDMLLMTRRKKQLAKKSSTICKSNSGGAGVSSQSGGGGGSGSGGGQSGVGHNHSASSMLIDDGSFKYVVYKQPLSLDRFYVHDVQQPDSQSSSVRHLFLLIVMNRFQQIINVHSFAAPNDDLKQTWLFKIKKTAARWKRLNNSTSGQLPQQQQQQQQQQPQQPQQQSISASKSMPMSSSCQPVDNRTPYAHIVQQPVQLAPRSQQLVQNHTQRGDANQEAARCPEHSIEFVITSASESPGTEHQKCR